MVDGLSLATPPLFHPQQPPTLTSTINWLLLLLLLLLLLYSRIESLNHALHQHKDALASSSSRSKPMDQCICIVLDVEDHDHVRLLDKAASTLLSLEHPVSLALGAQTTANFVTRRMMGRGC